MNCNQWPWPCDDGGPYWTSLAFILLFAVSAWVRSKAFLKDSPTWNRGEEWALGVLTVLLFYVSFTLGCP